MSTLFTNIHQLSGILESIQNRLAGTEMSKLKSLGNAWLLVNNGLISDFGEMDHLKEMYADETIDATGKLLLPAWVDSHTHLVFAAPREDEFVDRIKGLSYEEIARRGGGILNSAAKLNAMDEKQLFEQSFIRLQEVMTQGTGAIEIKSGYGLCMEGELKMLRVIRRLRESVDMPVKATFLAAHAYPLEFKENHEGYLRSIIDDMLPRVSAEGLADYMDVFCERGFFSIDDTARLLEAGAKHGLKPKIHANQLHHSGGVEVGVQQQAISVDHLECVGDLEIEALKMGSTMPTLLPGAAFFLGIGYQPARKIIDAGLPVCLATDYNPGSCPSGNIPLLLSIACTQLKMTPEEAINAVTINGAAALELEQDYGSVTKGKKANFILTKPMNSYNFIPYNYGNNPVERLMLQGKWI